MSERERPVGPHMREPLSDTFDGWLGTGPEGEVVAMVNVINSITSTPSVGQVGHLVR